MNKTCYICMMSFAFRFTSFCYAPVKFKCQHSSKNPSQRPHVSSSTRKGQISIVFQTIAITLALTELYLTATKENLEDNVMVLNTLELVAMLALVIRLVIANMSRKKKLNEIKVMIYISQYLNKFPVEDNFYVLNYNISMGFMIYSVLVYGSQVIVLLLVHKHNLLIFLKCVNRIIFGYLLTGLYLRIYLDTITYIIFFRRLLKQLSREIHSKLSEYQLLPTTKQLFAIHSQTNFLKKLKSLRRLYMATFGSFQRTRAMYSGALAYVVLGNFFIAIWILALSCIAIVGREQLRYSDYIIFLKFILRVLLLVVYAIICDRFQMLVEQVQSVMYKVPSRKLTIEEATELETFTKLLGWDEPMKTVRDSYRFGIGSMSTLALEIFVNSMVVTQLYIFLDQQLKGP